MCGAGQLAQAKRRGRNCLESRCCAPPAQVYFRFYRFFLLWFPPLLGGSDALWGDAWRVVRVGAVMLIFLQALHVFWCGHVGG